MSVSFEWNTSKAKSNLKDHKVSFDEAKTVFEDSLASLFFDPDHSEDEHREILIGYSDNGRLLIVSFTERSPDVIRIISARKASKSERLAHEKHKK